MVFIIETIFIAGGCFWGVEAYYKKLKGVISTEAGYANGHIENPTYEVVCSDTSGFSEAVKVEYDTNQISTIQIIEHLFRMIDPTSLNRQAHDIGSQYRSGIYYTNDAQKLCAQDFIQEEQKKYVQPIVVEVEPIKNFYTAESYHQDYLDKNPSGYCHINFNLIKEEERR